MQTGRKQMEGGQGIISSKLFLTHSAKGFLCSYPSHAVWRYVLHTVAFLYSWCSPTVDVGSLYVCALSRVFSDLQDKPSTVKSYQISSFKTGSSPPNIGQESSGFTVWINRFQGLWNGAWNRCQSPQSLLQSPNQVLKEFRATTTHKEEIEVSLQ